MARGWESKSIESQIEAAESRRQRSAGPHASPEQLARERERESLELSKRRVLRDLEAAHNQRYRESLQAALRYLEDKLAAFATGESGS